MEKAFYTVFFGHMTLARFLAHQEPCPLYFLLLVKHFQKYPFTCWLNAGSKGPAEQGTLVFLTAGSKELYDSALPLLEVMGKKSYFLGKVWIVQDPSGANYQTQLFKAKRSTLLFSSRFKKKTRLQQAISYPLVQFVCRPHLLQCYT